MSLLQVKNVSKHFGNLVAVNNISMTVEPGELRAIIGPNGAGKTTFFNLITGFFTPNTGRIIFDGRDVTDLLPARRVWCGIARTFQVTEVFPELSVRENLRISVEVASGLRLRPWLRRLITRLIAIVPAIIVLLIVGERGTMPLLILSQVILSLQLPFAVFPLVMFTSDRRKMGPFVSPSWVKLLAWAVALVIAVLNAWLLYQVFSGR